MIQIPNLKKKIFKLITNEKYEEALKLIERERVHGKDNSFYYSMYGVVHIYLENNYEAKLFINKALALNPTDLTGLNAMAYLYLQDSNIKNAIQLYLKILDLSPKSKIAEKNLFRFRTNKNLNRLTEKLDPDLYLRGRRLILKSYQKQTLLILIATLFFIIGYFFITPFLYRYNGEKVSTKDRERYFKVLYLTSKEKAAYIDKIKNEKHNFRSTTLSRILSSSISVEEKIGIEHRFRSIAIDEK